MTHWTRSAVEATVILLAMFPSFRLLAELMRLMGASFWVFVILSAGWLMLTVIIEAWHRDMDDLAK